MRRTWHNASLCSQAIRCRMSTIHTLQEQGTDDVLKNKFLNRAVHIIFQKFDKEMQTWSVDISLKEVLTGKPSSSNDPVLPPSPKEIPKSSLVQYDGQTIFEEEEYFLVLVSEVVDPSHFYCQRVFGIERLYSLMEEIAVHCEGLGPKEFSPQEGDIVCAQYTEDNKWYRAHLMDFLPGNSASVFYVDFGTSEALSMSRLRPSKVKFLQLSFQALRCSLGR
uniref:Tudor domain-containing protein n=1 Tax=Eptatretus burgeri TaxID=7764 RepID=A0A8C4NB64_EPTBU